MAILDIIRKLKLSYQTYNLFQKSKLVHNEKLYQQFGVKKRYYDSVSSRDFAQLPTNYVQPNIKGLQEDGILQDLPSSTQNSLKEYTKNGFAILKGFFTPQQVTAVNQDIEQLLAAGKVKFENKDDRIMFAVQHSNLLKKLGNDKQLTTVLNYLLDGEAVLFQSINFTKQGSQQKTHSDTIHMTTYPLGGLLGVWIALEDIELDNGPLHYYPTSHKLPYFLNEAFDNVGTKYFLGGKNYKDYENMIEEKVKKYGLKKQVFTAQKGDVLIWHANLLHGGEAHQNPAKTRKSMVFHYFKKDSICYHEITQRPALLTAY